MEGGSTASLATVWTDVSTFFSSGLTAAITVITANIILTAPLVIFVASRVLGMAKGLFKIGGKKRG